MKTIKKEKENKENKIPTKNLRQKHQEQYQTKQQRNKEYETNKKIHNKNIKQ